MVLFGALLVIACTKPENDLGLGILDPSAALGILETDSSALIAYPAEEPPVRTSGLSRNVLGGYLDHQSTNSVGVGLNNRGLVADSLVLALVFDLSSYGYGNLAPQRLKVFQLAEDLQIDSTYKDDRVPRIATLSDLIHPSRGLFIPDPFTAPVIDGDTLRPQLRIPLTPALAEKLLDAWGTSSLTDNTTFLQFFKGLWIRPDNGAQSVFQNGLLFFNLLDAQSKLTLYYRVARPGEEDTLKFDFLINDNCVRYTQVDHEFDLASDQGLQSALVDSTLGQNTTYVQSLGGIRSEVWIPNLGAYPANGMDAIAKAELVVPVDAGFHPYYQPPTQLFVFRKGSEGLDAFLPDQLSNTIGGIYSSDDKEYRFNITRWVQGVFNGSYANTGLSLVPSSNGVTANRALLNGPTHPERPMRLLLTFTTH